MTIPNRSTLQAQQSLAQFLTFLLPSRGSSPEERQRRVRPVHKGFLAFLAVPAAILLSACAIGEPTPPTAVSDTSATLNGTVRANTTGPVTYWFRYGQTTSYGTETPRRSISIEDDDKHPVSQQIRPLEPGSVYHWQMCVRDGDDNPPADICSKNQHFTTPPGLEGDSVSGLAAYETVGGPTGMNINAVSGPDGESAMGTAAVYICWWAGSCSTAHSSKGGQVTCMRVTGNRAIIGYYGTLVADFAFRTERHRGLIEILDNGPASARQDTIDGVYSPVPMFFAGSQHPGNVPITECPATLPRHDPHWWVPAGRIPPAPPGGNEPQDFTVVDAPGPPLRRTSVFLSGSARGGEAPFVQVDLDASVGTAGTDVAGSGQWYGTGNSVDYVAQSFSCMAVTAGVTVLGFTGIAGELPTSAKYRIAGRLRITKAAGTGNDTFELAYTEIGPETQYPNPDPPAIPGPTDCSSFPGQGAGTASSYTLTNGGVVMSNETP